MKVSIKGIGVVGGFGCGTDDLNRALSGRKVSYGDSRTDTSPVFEDHDNAFPADISCLDRFLPRRRLRRIDHFSQMAILGAYLALEDADSLDADRDNIGIVIATGYGASRTTFGFMDSVIDDGDSCASPTLFSNSVHNAAAANVSIFLNITGPILTISQFEMSVHSALISARGLLEEGRADSILFGGIDEYCDVLGYCRQRYLNEAVDPSVSPIDLSGQCREIGEGAAFFLLTRDEQEPARYGSIIDVQVGRFERKRLSLPEDAVVFLDADPYSDCGRSPYKRYIKTDGDIMTYNTLYGILPVGPAFDMAIACLSIKEGKLFVPAKSLSDSSDSLNSLKDDQDLVSPCISCVKFGREQEFGIVTIAGDHE